MITRDDLQLKCICCMDLQGCGIMQYRDDENKISAETTTPRNGFNYGKPKTIFHIDGEIKNLLIWMNLLIFTTKNLFMMVRIQKQK